MRLVLVVVMASLSGCTHVLRTGPNPHAKELAVQCKAAFPTDKSAVNWQRVGDACAPIFQRQPCRDAWAQLPESPTPEQFSALTQTCARAYCDLSLRHAVTACEEWRPLWSGRPMVDLHLFVLSRELGFDHADPWTPLGGGLEMQPPSTGESPGGLDKDLMYEVIKTTGPTAKTPRWTPWSPPTPTSPMTSRS